MPNISIHCLMCDLCEEFVSYNLAKQMNDPDNTPYFHYQIRYKYGRGNISCKMFKLKMNFTMFGPLSPNFLYFGRKTAV